MRAARGRRRAADAAPADAPSSAAADSVTFLELRDWATGERGTVAARRMRLSIAEIYRRISAAQGVAATAASARGCCSC